MSRRYSRAVRIRRVEDSEFARVGQLILDAYNGLPARVPEPAYDVELLDVASRVAAGCDVMVAVSDAGDLVGAVTYVGDSHNPYMESDDPDAASFRHMAVVDSAQGSGVGRAMVEWCIDTATVAGKQRIVIHSAEWMLGAHRLYDRLGFVRGDHVKEFAVEGSGLMVRLFEYTKEL